MAFESLSERFQRIFKKIRGQSRLTEANMDEMLKEVRIALLEADVNFKVVKEFTESIKQKAIGEEVYLKLNPGQMLVKIVHDELVELLGSDDSELHLQNNRPTIILLVGLQGSGTLLANVADVKSLVIHPYTTTHSQLSPEELAEQHITPATVRLSIGTEHIDDIIDDLSQAFDQI